MVGLKLVDIRCGPIPKLCVVYVHMYCLLYMYIVLDRKENKEL